MQRRNVSNCYPTTKYSRLSQDDDGFIDAQFKEAPKKIPWKAILFALTLFSLGSILLVVGSLLVVGHIDEKYGDRTWPLFILGFLMFIPGAYHTFIAYYAYKGYYGYSFDDIPSYDSHDR